MRTTFSYIIIFSCFFLSSSCSSDDSPNNNSESQAKLLGMWLYEGLTVNGEFEESPVEEGDAFYNFKTGGVLVVSEEGGSISRTYQLVGNNLTLNIDDETTTFVITKLTNTELDLFGMGDVDEEDGLDEVTFHLSKAEE